MVTSPSIPSAGVQPLEVSFNRIYILESLRADDRSTGSELHSDVLRWKDLAGGPQAVFKRLVAKADFEAYMRFILEDVLRGAVLPFIHLEMHGTREGLELTDGDMIVWQDLVCETRKINHACKNNLILSLAACSGAYIYETISPVEPTPFWGFIGPWNEVTAGDVMNFGGFFDSLLTDLSLNMAVDVLNTGIPPERHFHFYSSEEVFERVKRVYCSHLANPEKRSTRVQNIMGHALSNYFVRHMFTIPELRERVDVMLRDTNDEMWVKMKREFLGLEEAP